MKSEKGFSLIEVIASLAILGIIGVGLLGALAASSRATITMEERQTAASLAETQMEYAKSRVYGASYDPAPVLSGYPDYKVTTDTDAVPALSSGNIQKITVTVIRQDRTILELEDYKVR